MDDDLENDGVIIVFGLVSESPHFRLAYLINQALGLRLQRKEDKYFYYKKQHLLYPHYDFDDSNQDIRWLLTANKNPLHISSPKVNTGDIIAGLPLVPSLKQMDYFFWYHEDEGRENHMKELKADLSGIEAIRALQLVDPDTTKNIDNLISD